MTTKAAKRPAKKTATPKPRPLSSLPVATGTALPPIGAPYADGIFAGVTTDGERSYVLVLLPGDEELKWSAANDWATKQGGVLPSRIDQLVLFKNVKWEFQQRWYWSAEQYAGDAAYAWCQNFYYGYQSGSRKGVELRARAVRRLPI